MLSQHQKVNSVVTRGVLISSWRLFRSTGFSISIRIGKWKYTVELKCILSEEAVMKSFYTDPNVYKVVGVEMCIAYDIGLAMGATEAIVESYYSTMQSQAMQGGQLNDCLLYTSPSPRD